MVAVIRVLIFDDLQNTLGRYAVFPVLLAFLWLGSPTWSEDVDPYGKGTGPHKKIKESSGGATFLDQDSVFPWVFKWGGDQNYTMGLAFQGSGEWVGKLCISKPLLFLDGVFGLAKVHFRFASSQGREWTESHSLTFGHGAFTPKHLEIREPIIDDRPYSSLLFLTVSRATVDPYGQGMFCGRVIKTDFTVGVLGLRIGEKIQTSIHTSRRKKKGAGALKPYDPQGWPHQISDGGEPTVKYTVTYYQNLSSRRFYDCTLQAESSLGYYTNAASGVALRLGWIRSEFWTLMSNPITAANQALPVATEGIRRDQRKPELYAYGVVRGRAVLYNALLEGQFRDSDITLNDAEIEHVIRELEFGIVLGYRWVTGLIAVSRRSAEYNVGQPRPHTWGGVYLIVRKPNYANHS